MAADRRTSGGLSARIVRLTLVVGIATVIASATVALISTSRLSAEKSDSRALLAVQGIEDGVEGRLREVRAATEGVSQLIVQSGVLDTARRSLQDALARSGTVYEDAYVAESDNGLVVASMPSGARLSSIRRLPVFSEIKRGRSGFFSYGSTTDGSRELWYARTATTATGRSVVLLGKLDLRFLDRLSRRVLDRCPVGVS